MKKGLVTYILLIFIYMSGLNLFAQAPVVFKISEGVRPGSLISLYGEYMKGVVKVKFQETGSIVTPVQQDPGGQYIRIVMPAIASGAYTLSVSNDNGVTWGNSVYLNKADPRWLSETTAYPGMKIKLMGRNFSGCQYNSPGTTQLQLIPNTGGGSLTNIVPTTITPYAISFTLPANTSLGNYYVEVKTNSGGIGTQWVRHSETLDVVSAPTDPTALSLGVSWAKDYNWTYIKNIKTDFGATGDGSTDDSKAIQNAIDNVATNGGGIVYFPIGTYMHKSFTMKTGVILKGEDKVKTIIMYNGAGSTSPDGGDAILKNNGTGTIGLTNLTLSVDASKVTAQTTKLAWFYLNTRMFLYNINTDFPIAPTQSAHKDFGWIIDMPAGKFLVSGCNMKGTAFFTPHIQQTKFINNTVEISFSEISAWGHKSIFEGNHIIGSAIATSSQHGFFIDIGAASVKDIYYNDNLVENINSFTNQGEAFSTDGRGTYAVGPVTTATDNSVAITKEVVTDKTNQSRSVMIINGRGMGQKRDISSYSDTGSGITVTTSTNWDVIPDATSKCVIGDFAEDVVVENFTANNCKVGIQYFCNGYDNVFSTNSLTNTQGILTWTWTLDSDEILSYYCAIKNNKVSGASPQIGNTWIGIREESDQAHNAYVINDYGMEFRDNTVDRMNIKSGINQPRSTSACFAFGYNVGSITSGKGISALLLEGNKVMNNNNGIYITPGVDGTIERATVPTNISDQVFYNQGSSTITASGKPDSIHCDMTSVTLRDPENPANTTTGLNYSYYEGNWNALPDFTTITPVKKGTLNNFDITPRNKDIQYGFSFTGYVNIPAGGQYTFYTTSDDGSRLYIGNTLVADNDGLHASQEKSGTIGLKAGKHAITVTFFQQGGGANLSVSYEGPSLAKTTIPASELYRVIPVASVNTLFTTQTPSGVFTDGPYELGMKFQTSDSGTVTGIKYYKASGESGSHTGRIWSGSGTQLASIVFNNESASGWQEAPLATPLSIPAKTTYVVTVNSNTAYGATNQGLGQVITNGSISSIADSANGVYGSVGVYPTGTYQNTNYFRDIEFIKATQSTNVSTAKIYPRTGFSSRMQSGKFQGSNDNTVWTDLASITTVPTESSWTTYNLISTTSWRYLRYLSPAGGYGNVSELEFYNGSTKLTGTAIGTAGSWSNSGNTKEKALDGDVSTFFDAPTADNSYVGIDAQGTAARIAGEPGKLHTIPTSTELRVYPNPATKEVTIDSETLWIRLSIMDINGKEKLSRTNYNRTEKIELSGMQSGVYIIKIQTREGIQIKKLVIY